jgi:hypothetical protein
MVTAVYDGLLEPAVGVYVTKITQGLPDFTEPDVGAIAIYVLLLVVVIQEGRDVPSAIVIEVKAPVVGQEFAVQVRIAGVEI